MKKDPKQIKSSRLRTKSTGKRAAIAALLLCFAAAGGAVFSHFQHARTLKYVTTMSDARVPFVEASLRPKYPYSVIPGGVYSSAELQQAIKKDPSLGNHYAGFDVNKSKLVRLTENHYGYVSYRIKNQIFWTRRRVKLPKGEVLLSDGSQYVRCRCGNRISDKAQVTVAPLEPLEAALSLPPMTLDNLADFDFAEAPRTSDTQLPLVLDQLREFDADSLQDAASEARILLKNPPPSTSGTPWLAALPLAALPFLAFDHGHSAIQPNNFVPGNPGGNGGKNPTFPIEPPQGPGNNIPVIPPIPPVSSEPEPIELGVELIVVSALIGTKLGLLLRRRPR